MSLSTPVVPSQKPTLFTEKDLEIGQEYPVVNINAETKDRISVGEEQKGKAVACTECLAQPRQFHAIGCERELCPVCLKPLMHCSDSIAFD